MEQCEQFMHLLEAVKKYSNDVRLVKKTFATGTILGFVFRLFQEMDTSNKVDGYCAWLGIKDETAKGSQWPAFYNGHEIDEWVQKHSDA